MHKSQTKILFGLTDLQASEFFEKAPLPITRRHSYKMYGSILLPQSEPNSLVNELLLCGITYRTLLILVRLLVSFAPSKL